MNTGVGGDTRRAEGIVVAGTRRRPRRDAAGPEMAMGSVVLRGGIRTAEGEGKVEACGENEKGGGDRIVQCEK